MEPDGSQLAWVSWEGNGGNIYKINFKLKVHNRLN